MDNSLEHPNVNYDCVSLDGRVSTDSNPAQGM